MARITDRKTCIDVYNSMHCPMPRAWLVQPARLVTVVRLVGLVFRAVLSYLQYSATPAILALAAWSLRVTCS